MKSKKKDGNNIWHILYMLHFLHILHILHLLHILHFLHIMHNKTPIFISFPKSYFICLSVCWLFLYLCLTYLRLSSYLYFRPHLDSWHHGLSENIWFEGSLRFDGSVTAYLWTQEKLLRGGWTNTNAITKKAFKRCYEESGVETIYREQKDYWKSAKVCSRSHPWLWLWKLRARPLSTGTSMSWHTKKETVYHFCQESSKAPTT